jgi:hypothetical protein
MTIKASGASLSFSEIAAEFGSPTGKNLGAYRISQSVGTFTNLPLDTGIPQSGQIKFSDFYSKKLNIVLDCTGMSNVQTRVNARSLYDTPSLIGGVSVSVIGGFKSKPNDTSTSKVYINTNTQIGSNQGDARIVAFRTGSWQSGTDLRLENGTSGLIIGSGGNGGSAGNPASGGNNGTSALGIDYPTTIVNRGTILAGGGGGGGGGNAFGRSRRRRGFNFAFDSAYASGAGGGGGRGYPGGSGGSGGRNGDVGYIYSAGGGGSSFYQGARNCDAYGGAGGNGGSGSSGSDGQNGAQNSYGLGIPGTYAGSGGGGGAAGYSIIFYNDSSGSSITNYGTLTGSYAYNTAVL